jgi:hypothetical protein
VQRKLLYPEAEWAAGKQTVIDFGKDDHAMINAAEPFQLPQLADKLGQEFVIYKPGAPPDLAGERINYLVGHVTFGSGGQDKLDPYWAGQGPAAIVADLVAGHIEAGSALKILGCLGGVSLAPQIATRLAAAGKAGVSVIASADIVHATGAGIVSFPMKNPGQASPLAGAYATRNNSGKKLIKTMAAMRKELEAIRAKALPLQEAADKAIAGGGDAALINAQLAKDLKPLRDRCREIIRAFVQLAGAHFDATVGAFGGAYGAAAAPHATPQNQGWRKYVGNNVAQDLTPADERPDRPAPALPPPVALPVAVLAQAQPQAQGGAQPAAALVPPMAHPLVAPVLAAPQAQQHGPQPVVGVDARNNHPLMPGYVRAPQGAAPLPRVDATHNHPLM